MAHAHALRDNTGMIAGIAAMAAGIGAITAMLVTPRTGQEVRGGIKRRTFAAKDAVAHKFDHAKDQTKDMAGDMQSKAQGIAEETKTAAKAQSKKTDE